MKWWRDGGLYSLNESNRLFEDESANATVEGTGATGFVCYQTLSPQPNRFHKSLVSTFPITNLGHLKTAIRSGLDEFRLLRTERRDDE